MPELPLLSKEERQRYARHLSVPGIGVDGQRRLKGSSVLMIGTGGLGWRDDVHAREAVVLEEALRREVAWVARAEHRGHIVGPEDLPDLGARRRVSARGIHG